MTEAEWLACEDPANTLRFLGEKASDRKLRLFSCACCRLIPGYLESESYRAALELAEQDADRPADEAAIRRLKEKWGMEWRRRAAPDAVELAMQSYWETMCDGQRYLDASSRSQRRMRMRVNRPLADLIRDIFGNPFRLIVFSPVWRTDTILAIAQQMYDSRDFSAMPILADALQDAGCDNDDVLNHCRGSGLHVRGCWVVDSVLGKE